MAERLIGTGTTNANGVASVTYTGNGRGKIDIIAKSGTIQSEIYATLDCMMISSDDTTFINYLKVSNSTGIELDGEWVKLTTGSESGSNYCGLYWGNSNTVIYGHTLSDFLGKSFRCLFDFETEDASQWHMIVYAYVNNNFTVITDKYYLTTGNDQYIDFTLPSDSTRLWIRLQSTNRNSTYIAKTKNWRVYPI